MCCSWSGVHNMKSWVTCLYTLNKYRLPCQDTLDQVTLELCPTSFNTIMLRDKGTQKREFIFGFLFDTERRDISFRKLTNYGLGVRGSISDRDCSFSLHPYRLTTQSVFWNGTSVSSAEVQWLTLLFCLTDSILSPEAEYPGFPQFLLANTEPVGPTSPATSFHSLSNSLFTIILPCDAMFL